ncbi:hypothetical protein E2C01_007925 [Portunus trituberculatus]|uniref:Uncharacterized protein n=1 Tax=Portunus trituberculatus TaxID=210409 RepID=A0A5B7CZF5_PORTR|nr:hypothetical protein [Portunus trituberculatus]
MGLGPMGPIPGGLDARRNQLRSQVSLEGHLHNTSMMRGTADGQDTRGPTTMGTHTNATQSVASTTSGRPPVGGVKLPGMGTTLTTTSHDPMSRMHGQVTSQATLNSQVNSHMTTSSMNQTNTSAPNNPSLVTSIAQRIANPSSQMNHVGQMNQMNQMQNSLGGAKDIKGLGSLLHSPLSGRHQQQAQNVHQNTQQQQQHNASSTASSALSGLSSLFGLQKNRPDVISSGPVGYRDSVVLLIGIFHICNTTSLVANVIFIYLNSAVTINLPARPRDSSGEAATSPSLRRDCDPRRPARPGSERRDAHIWLSSPSLWLRRPWKRHRLCGYI